jgi:hypothetical protein
MKHLIFKKLEDGTYGEKLGSYEGPKDDSSAQRSYLQAEPLASHFEMPEGADEDCCILVLVPEVLAVEAQPEKWTKEGETDVFVDPQDETWTHAPAVAGVEGVPAHYEVQEDASLVTAKAQAVALQNVQNILANAKAFGENLMNEFTTENIMLGITADSMTGTVRKNMVEVIMALQTGSLYDAITEAKAIPADKKDAKYITDARLLAFVNKIETYLGVALSQTL